MEERFHELKLQLEEAFNIIGTSMMSDERCCKLLAWLSEFGGGQEAVVNNQNLFADIKIAQKRLNIFGGEIPNANLVPKMQEYIKEAKTYDGVNIIWVTEIFNHYQGLHNPFKQTQKRTSKKSKFL